MFGFLKKVVRAITTFIPVVVAFFSAVAVVSAEVIERSGSTKKCVDGKMYSVNYSSNGYSDDHFINIDIPTEYDIVNVLRDIDKTRMIIEFSGSKFMNKILAMPDPKFLIDGFVVRRILGYTPSPKSIELLTSQAKYDEIFESADVSIAKDSNCLQEKMQDKEGTMQCSLCKLIISEVEKMLESNHTEEKIIQVLDKVCDTLPVVVRGVCRGFVELYLPQLIDLLVKKEPPEVVCKQIGICKISRYFRGNEIDVPICLGANTADCRSAKGSIPLYSNPTFGVDVSCTNCFLGFHTDFFFEMHISSFKLTSVSGGLKNTALEGALVIDSKVKETWGTGVDKQIADVTGTIITFHIGPIPVRVWYDIPVRVVSSVVVSASGELQVGATMKWNLGDNYLSWDPVKHWVEHHSKPVFSWTPVLGISGDVHGEADASIVPTIKLHVDNIYTVELTVKPTMYAEVKGSIAERKICGTLSYDVDLIMQSELHFNIPLIHTLIDKTWGPTTIYDTGVTPIGTKCIVFRNSLPEPSRIS